MDTSIMLGAVCVPEKGGVAAGAGQDGLGVIGAPGVDREEMVEEADLLVEYISACGTDMGP